MTASQPLTRDEIEHRIANVWSLAEYIAFINGEDGNLVSDATLWAQDGITTAAQLADYLDGTCQRAIEKSERCG